MKEIIKITAEKKMSLKKIQRANECKSWFFEKINKIDEPLTRLMKKKRGKTQIYKIRNKRGKITMDTKEMQRIFLNTIKYMPTNWIIWMEWINSY